LFSVPKDDITTQELSALLLIISKFFIFTKRNYEFIMISKELLDILCCPETKADLVLDGNTLVSTDKNTRRRYRIEDDIPVMLIDESEQLSVEEWKEIMKRHNKVVD
jgi:uncharacterized protein YbaR (Trm112 family)